jgi:hypothetical protein
MGARSGCLGIQSAVDSFRVKDGRAQSARYTARALTPRVIEIGAHLDGLPNDATISDFRWCDQQGESVLRCGYSELDADVP